MDEDLKENKNTRTGEDGSNPDSVGTPETPVEPPTEPTEPSRDNFTYKDIVDFYERVRLALNAVSEVTLPDKYMDYPEKAPFSEMYVKGRVPHWKELSDEKFAVFESIIVYKTASLFQSLVSNKRIKKKSIPTITLEYFDDGQISDMSLDDMVEYLLGELNDEENITANFIGFKVTDAKNRCCKRAVYGRYDYIQ